MQSSQQFILKSIIHSILLVVLYGGIDRSVETRGVQFDSPYLFIFICIVLHGMTERRKGSSGEGI
jgi:hypothetical protein